MRSFYFVKLHSGCINLSRDLLIIKNKHQKQSGGERKEQATDNASTCTRVGCKKERVLLMRVHSTVYKKFKRRLFEHSVTD